MFTRLVALANKNFILAIFIKTGLKIALCAIRMFNSMQGFLRSKGFFLGRYKKLLRYRNAFAGERCFIIATGPSLTISDLDLIRDEYTFGMNSICGLYQKTSFRPTFYGIQDQFVYAAIEEDIRGAYSDKQNVFVSDRIARYFKVDTSWNIFPLHVAYNTYDRWFHQKYSVKFSDNAIYGLYSGFNITYTLIELATYMGFTDIYLLGADCSFSKNGVNHVSEHGVIDPQIESARERNLAGYYAAKKYADNNNVHIYNATRGGELEVFQRVNLENVVNM